MKHFMLLIIGLLLICGALLMTARGLGHVIEWPFRFAQRLPIPTAPPYDDLFPPQIGDFVRIEIMIPMRTVKQSRLMAIGSATYARPGEAHYVYLELRLYPSAEIAGLLINPSDWRLHSLTSDRYYVDHIARPYVFTALQNSYHNYTLDYVSGSWNVSMRAVNNLAALRLFANLYPY